MMFIPLCKPNTKVSAPVIAVGSSLCQGHHARRTRDGTKLAETLPKALFTNRPKALDSRSIFRLLPDLPARFPQISNERPLFEMKRFAATTMVCLIALSAAGCAIEVPMSSFRLAPPDETGGNDNARRHQDLKHIQTR